jgi:eukaryotic-like serine/threonine-protein kinase
LAAISSVMKLGLTRPFFPELFWPKPGSWAKSRSGTLPHCDVRTDLQRLKRDKDSAQEEKGSRIGAATSIGLRWKLIIPAAVAVLALSVVGYFYLRRTPKLTDKDTIILADFANTTGDPVFDGTLRQGMAVQLEQSPFLSLVSEERIQQALRLMGQTADTRLTPEVAREICERTASAAVLDGSIANLGSQYVLGLRAKDCRTGDILAEEQVQAARKEDVLNALGQIASRFRTRVGESLATVEKYDTPLAEGITTSLEALRAYTAGFKVLSSAGSAAAVPFFKRAVETAPPNSPWPMRCSAACTAALEKPSFLRTARPKPMNCGIAPVTKKNSLFPPLTIGK